MSDLEFLARLVDYLNGHLNPDLIEGIALLFEAYSDRTIHRTELADAIETWQGRQSGERLAKKIATYRRKWPQREVYGQGERDA